ncbi:hypothetical protein E4U30_001820 [Claviceps sp. LM220 group G6]|nr:hypothetical protein E4U30_001820 [Claviceps sp. LM220 group G6]
MGCSRWSNLRVVFYIALQVIQVAICTASDGGFECGWTGQQLYGLHERSPVAKSASLRRCINFLEARTAFDLISPE